MWVELHFMGATPVIIWREMERPSFYSLGRIFLDSDLACAYLLEKNIFYATLPCPNCSLNMCGRWMIGSFIVGLAPVESGFLFLPIHSSQELD
jgi:hypothetical protein